MSNTMGKLGRQIAITTGVRSGFGEGIVHIFTLEGAQVLIIDINLPLAHKIASAQPANTTYMIRANVGSEADWHTALSIVLKKFGGFDIVMNNAGVI